MLCRRRCSLDGDTLEECDTRLLSTTEHDLTFKSHGTLRIIFFVEMSYVTLVSSVHNLRGSDLSCTPVSPSVGAKHFAEGSTFRK